MRYLKLTLIFSTVAALFCVQIFANEIECTTQTLFGNKATSAQVIRGDAKYPESPIWMNGKLYYVEYANHRVMVWDGRSNREFWKSEGCGPAAIARLSKGSRFLVSCYDRNEIVILGTLENSGKIAVVEKLITGTPGQLFKGPNDFGIDSLGGVYFTASGVFDLKAPIEGEVWYLSITGKLNRVASGIHYANGLAVSPDGKALFVSEHLKNRVLKFNIKRQGVLGPKAEIFFDLNQLPPVQDLSGGLQGPDGIRFGPGRKLFVAQYGASRIIQVDQNSRLTGILELNHKSEQIKPLAGQSPYPNTDNVWIQKNRLYGSAVSESSTNSYPGIIFSVDIRSKCMGRVNCEL